MLVCDPVSVVVPLYRTGSHKNEELEFTIDYPYCRTLTTLHCTVLCVPGKAALPGTDSATIYIHVVNQVNTGAVLVPGHTTGTVATGSLPIP